MFRPSVWFFHERYPDVSYMERFSKFVHWVRATISLLDNTSQSPSVRVPTSVYERKVIEQPGRHRWTAESTNHHCRGRSSQENYC
jgi:hypothetical protein